jgi:hypothetical protein
MQCKTWTTSNWPYLSCDSQDNAGYSLWFPFLSCLGKLAAFFAQFPPRPLLFFSTRLSEIACAATSSMNRLHLLSSGDPNSGQFFCFFGAQLRGLLSVGDARFEIFRTVGQPKSPHLCLDCIKGFSLGVLSWSCWSVVDCIGLAGAISLNRISVHELMVLFLFVFCHDFIDVIIKELCRCFWVSFYFVNQPCEVYHRKKFWVECTENIK